MRSAYRAIGLLVCIAGAMGGCAAISGLNGITEQTCAPDCDGGSADAAVVGADGSPPGIDSSPPPGSDVTVPPEAAPTPSDDATSPEDARSTFDATGPDGGDGGAADAGKDASGPDAAHDASSDAGTTDAGGDAAVDAGPDTGCGPLDSINNCSACGDKCSGANASTTSCNGATCSYACKANFLDCNGTAAPDLDGCECNAPGATLAQCCAGGACPQPHHYDLDLLSSTFYDCVAAGTYNKTVALDACAASTGDATQCDNGGTSFTCSYPDGGLAGNIVCSNGPSASVCSCWGYTGAVQGMMATGTAKGNANCPCPQPGGTLWN